ncbi:MAG: shikimate dehydrogenase [Bacteroidota bacterium]
MKLKYGLIGYPLGHSFSKTYFTEKFAAEGIQAFYDLYPLHDINQLKKLLESTPNLHGLNVTIPFKKDIIRFLDEITPEAASIGAVNTISIRHDGNSFRLKGWNTDAPAFEAEIKRFTANQTGNAMVLGNGGASAAACYVLAKLGWKITIVTRKPEISDESCILYSAVSDRKMKSTHLIVNTTPVGMYPRTDELPPLPVGNLNENHLVFDMVYNPEITRLMATAAEKGAKTCNGLGMLHRQADLSWKIWTESDGR